MQKVAATQDSQDSKHSRHGCCNAQPHSSLCRASLQLDTTRMHACICGKQQQGRAKVARPHLRVLRYVCLLCSVSTKDTRLAHLLALLCLVIRQMHAGASSMYTTCQKSRHTTGPPRTYEILSPRTTAVSLSTKSSTSSMLYVMQHASPTHCRC